MIQKLFEDIRKADIDALITNHVREDRTIEYKQTLPGNSDEDKREFLADVSSFANAGGGDLLFGVTAVNGEPQVATGVKADADTEKLRLENIIRDGLDPRIPVVQLHPYEGFPEGYVFMLRIPKSWAAPHMVKFKNLSRFYTRNSAGKHQMDTVELRAAFVLSESLPEKIKRFRDERLGRIIAGQTPLPLCTGAKIILHILPIASFSAAFSIDMSKLQQQVQNLMPIVAFKGWQPRFNLDGFVTYCDSNAKEKSLSYCQIFRSGQIESVSADLVTTYQGKRIIVGYEEEVLKAIQHYFNLLKTLEVPYPLLVSLAFTGVAGVHLSISNRIMNNSEPIDRDELVFPDVLIEEYAQVSGPQAAAKILRPIFDAVWNSCGFERSFNYDDKGEWRSHP